MLENKGIKRSDLYNHKLKKYKGVFFRIKVLINI